MALGLDRTDLAEATWSVLSKPRVIFSSYRPPTQSIRSYYWSHFVAVVVFLLSSPKFPRWCNNGTWNDDKQFDLSAR